MLKELYAANDDTASFEPKVILPMDYDHTQLKQRPDEHQPTYVLEKYFRRIDKK